MEGDGHGETKLHAAHVAPQTAPTHGSYTYQTETPIAGRDGIGSQARMGCEPVGKQVTQKNVVVILPECRAAHLPGGDPETTPWGWADRPLAVFLLVY